MKARPNLPRLLLRACPVCRGDMARDPYDPTDYACIACARIYSYERLRRHHLGVERIADVRDGLLDGERPSAGAARTELGRKLGESNRGQGRWGLRGSLWSSMARV